MTLSSEVALVHGGPLDSASTTPGMVPSTASTTLTLAVLADSQWTVQALQEETQKSSIRVQELELELADSQAQLRWLQSSSSSLSSLSVLARPKVGEWL